MERVLQPPLGHDLACRKHSPAVLVSIVGPGRAATGKMAAAQAQRCSRWWRARASGGKGKRVETPPLYGCGRGLRCDVTDGGSR
ncbi:unnamed protein product [Coccothraustes coccothraustes]